MKTVTRTKKDKLTIKERKLIRELAKGKSVQQAAKDAGYAASTASSDVYNTIDKPRVQSAFQEILEKQGITDEKLGQALQEGLEAYKVISANIIKNGQTADEQDGMKDANENTRDFVEVPDFMARHKFIDTVLKLKSHYPAEKVDHNHKGSIDLRHEADQELIEWLQARK